MHNPGVVGFIGQVLHTRSRRLSIAVGIELVLVGLLLNQWFLGWRLANDGNIDSTILLASIWGIQFVCISAGLWMVLRSRARQVYIAVVGGVTGGLLVGILLVGRNPLAIVGAEVSVDNLGGGASLYRQLFPGSYVPGSSVDVDYLPPQIEGSPSGSPGFSHLIFDRTPSGQVLLTTVEGPQGQQVRSSMSYLQLKQVYEGSAPVPEELRMTREELGELVGQLDTVRSATEKYRDVEVALAEGYIQNPKVAPNMGAHFNNPERLSDGVFDPAKPEILLYVRDANDEWELVGTAFVLPHALQEGNDHPDGFAGPLDNWHIHYNTCLGIGTKFQISTQDTCSSRGGEWFPAIGWMIHAYVWEDNPLGVFQAWNPNIGPAVPAGGIPQAFPETVPAAGEVALTIKDFELSEVVIKKGQTVVWTNEDQVFHTVTSGFWGAARKGFDSAYIAPGQSFTRTFDQPGVYLYTCTLHRPMNGTIIVTE